jgi:hypothetical protein
MGNMGDQTGPQKIWGPQFTIQPMQKKGSALCGLFYYQERGPRFVHMGLQIIRTVLHPVSLLHYVLAKDALHISFTSNH